MATMRSKLAVAAFAAVLVAGCSRAPEIDRGLGTSTERAPASPCACVGMELEDRPEPAEIREMMG